MPLLFAYGKTGFLVMWPIFLQNNISKNVTASPWRQDWIDKSEAGQHEVILKVSRRLLQVNSAIKDLYNQFQY